MRGYTLPLVLAAAVLVPSGVRASQVRPVNLEQMTERAARIFSGRCIETSVVLDPALGRHVSVATFEVERTVKGEASATVTVRMTAGLPPFRAGDEVVLFLYGESALGLTSPVGFGQGRFMVLTDKLGRRLALNDFANRNLLSELTPTARTRLGASLAVSAERSDLTPAALLDMVDSLVAVEP